MTVDAFSPILLSAAEAILALLGAPDKIFFSKALGIISKVWFLYLLGICHWFGLSESLLFWEQLELFSRWDILPFILPHIELLHWAYWAPGHHKGSYWYSWQYCWCFGGPLGSVILEQPFWIVFLPFVLNYYYHSLLSFNKNCYFYEFLIIYQRIYQANEATHF